MSWIVYEANMHILSIVMDYNLRVSPFAVFGKCSGGCYESWRTADGFRKTIRESNGTYAACIITSQGELVHTIIPVMIGSDLDVSIRGPMHTLEDSARCNLGTFVVNGIPAVVSNQIVNRVRGGFVFRSASDLYFKVGFRSAYGEKVSIVYRPSGEFTVTSSHHATMNGKFKNVAGGARSSTNQQQQQQQQGTATATNRSAQHYLPVGKEETVDGFDIMLFLNQQNNMRGDSVVTLSEFESLCKDRLDVVTSMDALANKFIMTPGSIFNGAFHFFFGDDDKRLFVEGCAYTPHYDGRALDGGRAPISKTTAARMMTLARSAFETGNLHIMLNMIKQHNLYYTNDAGERVVYNSPSTKAISSGSRLVDGKSFYDNVEGQKHDKLNLLLTRCKRANNKRASKSVSAHSYPREDGEHFVCPVSVKEMKGAGETIDLCIGVFVSLGVPESAIFEFLRKRKEGGGVDSHRIAIDWKLTPFRASPTIEFLREIKSHFPCLIVQPLARHIVLYPSGYVPMKYSHRYGMFLSPVEVQNTIMRRLVPDPFVDHHPVLRFGVFALSFCQLTTNTVPGKLTVGQNNMRGACNRFVSDDNADSFLNYPGTNVALCLGRDARVLETGTRLGTNGAASDDVAMNRFAGSEDRVPRHTSSCIVDVACRAVVDRRSDPEYYDRLVSRVTGGLWKDIRSHPEWVDPPPDNENVNVVGYRLADLWPGGSKDVQTMARLLFRQMDMWNTSLREVNVSTGMVGAADCSFFTFAPDDAQWDPPGVLDARRWYSNHGVSVTQDLLGSWEDVPSHLLADRGRGFVLRGAVTPVMTGRTASVVPRGLNRLERPYFDGWLQAVALPPDHKERRPNQLLMTFAFGDVDGSTNEDGIVMDGTSTSSGSVQKMVRFLQTVRILRSEPIVGGVNANVRKKGQFSKGTLDVKYQPYNVWDENIFFFGVVITRARVTFHRKEVVRIVSQNRGDVSFHYLFMLFPLRGTDWRITSHMREVPVRGDPVRVSLVLQLEGSAIESLSAGTKLSVPYGQKGIVPTVVDLSRHREFWAATPDGRVIYPQLLFSPISFVGRSATVQAINPLSCRTVGLTLNGGLVGCIPVNVSNKTVSTILKHLYPNIDIMTHENGYVANGLAYTAQILCAKVAAVTHRFILQQFECNGSRVLCLNRHNTWIRAMSELRNKSLPPEHFGSLVKEALHQRQQQLQEQEMGEEELGELGEYEDNAAESVLPKNDKRKGEEGEEEEEDDVVKGPPTKKRKISSQKGTSRHGQKQGTGTSGSQPAGEVEEGEEYVPIVQVGCKVEEEEEEDEEEEELELEADDVVPEDEVAAADDEEADDDVVVVDEEEEEEDDEDNDECIIGAHNVQFSEDDDDGDGDD